jgi:hypothetical protein
MDLPNDRTIERKVVRQVTVPVVRRVRVPVSTYGAPPNQPDGWRVDELRVYIHTQSLTSSYRPTFDIIK